MSGIGQLAVVLVFHIVQAEDGLASGKTFILQDAAAMNAFEEDGMFIVQQIVHQLCAAAGSYNVGQFVREALVAALAFIILYRCAILFQLGLWAAAIFETMQVDLHTCLVQGHELIKEIEHPTVINGVGYVQGNDM